MAEKKEATASDLGRKAYGAAVADLRAAHRDEFDRLLDKAYADLGVESPRLRRERKKAEVFAAKTAAAEKREAAREAKIAKMEAELAALRGVAADPIF